MNIAEIDAVTKSVLRESTIESSSDFVNVTYELYRRFFPKMAVRIQPIIDIESDNHHEDWVSNSVYSEQLMYQMNPEQLYDAMIAYRVVMDYFLNDDIVSKRFNLDEADILGWKIYKELDTKYNWCRKRLNKFNYSQKGVLCEH